MLDSRDEESDEVWSLRAVQEAMGEQYRDVSLGPGSILVGLLGVAFPQPRPGHYALRLPTLSTLREADLDAIEALWAAEAATHSELHNVDDILNALNQLDETPSQLRSLCNPADPTQLYFNLRMIGRGAAADVFEAFEKLGKRVAIKKIHAEMSDEQILCKEVMLMKSTQHPNIITFHDAFLHDQYLWMVLEFMDGGDLYSVIAQHAPLRERQIAYVCRELLQGLAYCHSVDRVHRDIKSDNVLVSRAGHIKLADFGAATEVSEERRMTEIGTPYWMAPEVILGEPYGKKVDVWSLGIILREMAVGDPPFIELPPMVALGRIVASELPPLTGSWSPLMLQFQDLCLKKNQFIRPTSQDLLSHIFIQSACTPQEFAVLLTNK